MSAKAIAKKVKVPMNFLLSSLRMTLAIAPFVWLGLPSRAIAHGAVLQYSTTQAYEITAAYDSGQPMTAAQVAIFSPDNPSTPWMMGTTDDQGQFLFTPPTPGNWEVQVRQAGHGDVVVIPVSDRPTSSTEGGAEGDRSRSGAFDNWQKGLMAGSVLWGCVGTALFFSQKQSSQPSVSKHS
jgi:nickel transport protein